MHLNKKKISVLTTLLLMTLFSSSIFALTLTFSKTEFKESIVVNNNSSQKIAVISPIDLTIEPGGKNESDYFKYTQFTWSLGEQKDLTQVNIVSSVDNTPICNVNATLIYDQRRGLIYDRVIGRGLDSNILIDDPRCKADFVVYPAIHDLDLVITVSSSANSLSAVNPLH